MKDRIRQIMEDHRMSQKEFAQKCGISDATLSQVFSGKTGATQKTVQKVLSAFPDVSLAWLMYGQGAAYENGPAGGGIPASGEDVAEAWDFAGAPSPQEPASPAADLTRGDVLPSSEAFAGTHPAARPDAWPASRMPAAGVPGAPAGMPGSGVRSGLSAGQNRGVKIVKYFDKPERQIREIRIFFDDGTYETFVPQGK